MFYYVFSIYYNFLNIFLRDQDILLWRSMPKCAKYWLLFQSSHSISYFEIFHTLWKLVLIVLCISFDTMKRGRSICDLYGKRRNYVVKARNIMNLVNGEKYNSKYLCWKILKLRGRISFLLKILKNIFWGEHLWNMIRISKLNIFNQKQYLLHIIFILVNQIFVTIKNEEIVDLLGFNLNILFWS